MKQAILIWLVSSFLILCCPHAALAGYTHYWNWHELPNDAVLRNCISQMKLVIMASDGLLAGPDGTGSPILSDTSVQFNGIAEAAHEAFSFPGKVGFNFCKTECKPYDKVVVACLLVAAEHFPAGTLKISSDGQWTDQSWRSGFILYGKVFGRPAHNPLEDESGSTLPQGGSMSIITLCSFALLIVVTGAFVLTMRRGGTAKQREYIAKTEEHMERAKAHMEKVEVLLQRIAEAEEKKTSNT